MLPAVVARVVPSSSVLLAAVFHFVVARLRRAYVARGCRSMWWPRLPTLVARVCFFLGCHAHQGRCALCYKPFRGTVALPSGVPGVLLLFVVTRLRRAYAARGCGPACWPGLSFYFEKVI